MSGSILHGVSHYNKLYWFLVLHNYRVNTVDSGKQAAFVSANALKVSFLDSLEGIKVGISHSLDNEPLILREEEKAATFSLGFSCFEDHLLVLLWVETITQYFIIEAIFLSKESKNIWRVLNNMDVLVDDKFFVKRDGFARITTTLRKPSQILVISNLGHIPVVLVFDFNAFENEFVGTLVIIVIVDFEVVVGFCCAYRFRTDSRQNDVHKLNIQRAHEERKQGALYLSFLRLLSHIVTVRRQLTPVLVPVHLYLAYKDWLLDSDK